jgi:hypothetical protein
MSLYFNLDKYGDLIHKFNKLAEKPEKKKPKALLNESDYSDDSIDFGLINIDRDKVIRE